MGAILLLNVSFEKSDIEMLQEVVLQIELVIERIRNNKKLFDKIDEIKRWKKVTVDRELEIKEF